MDGERSPWKTTIRVTCLSPRARQVSCEFIDTLPEVADSGDNFVKIMKKCTLEHENSHGLDSPLGCKGQKDGATPRYPPGYDRKRSECKALAVSIRCFRMNAGMCQGDRQCLDAVKDQISDQKDLMRTLRCEDRYGIRTPN